MKKTISQHFQEFVYECQFVRKVHSETIRGYEQTFKLFLSLLPNITLEEISYQRIIQFFKTLEQRKRTVGKGIIKVGIKKSTVATYWSKLNVFFEWLTAKKLLHTNPFHEIPYPSPVYEDKKYLKKEDIEKIITAIHTRHNNNIFLLKRNLVVFYLFLFCGLRREEVMSLQVRDIDFDRKVLTVRAETSKSKLNRQIPLHSTTLMYLKDYLSARKLYTTPYLIVSSSADEKLTNNGLKHLIEVLTSSSGISFHVHQLRHTFAVNFLKTSNNIAKLKQLLGHKNISMTLTYLRCLPVDELRGDIESMQIDSFL